MTHDPLDAIACYCLDRPVTTRELLAGPDDLEDDDEDLDDEDLDDDLDEYDDLEDDEDDET